MEITEIVQIANALVVSGIRRNLADPHEFGPGDADGVFEPAGIPELEQGYIHADVRGVEPIIVRDAAEKTR